MALLLATLAVLAATATGAPVHNETRVISAASNSFAVDLYKVLSETPGNLVLSPVSALAALSLAWAGARGQTALELQKALHLPADVPPERSLPTVGALLKSLQQRSNATLRIANHMFVKRGLALKEEFKRAAVTVAAGAGDAVFPDPGRAQINEWVERCTDGRIKDLFLEGDLDDLTLMVLVNSIYFLGNWKKPFVPQGTRSLPFQVSVNSRVDAPMMQNEGWYGHSQIPELGASVLDLPYKGGAMRMLIVLPDAVDGIEKTEAALSKVAAARLRPAKKRYVRIAVPKFRLTNSLQLQEMLPKLGVNMIFQDSADLSGITEERAHVDKVLQKAFVEVTETGTIAAAATGVSITNRIGQAVEAVFKADHPFLFFIMHGDTIVFMGRIVNPV